MQHAGVDNILKKTSNKKNNTSAKTFDFRKRENFFVQYNNVKFLFSLKYS